MLPAGWNQIRQIRAPDQMHHFTAMTMNPPMVGNMSQQPFGVYSQPFMHPPQIFQQQMIGSFMPAPPSETPIQPAPKPPEPLNSPPPPLPKEIPKPTPPAVEEKWWVAELDKLPSAYHRDQLLRMSSEKWFNNLTMHQQIECWQHKMQLIPKYLADTKPDIKQDLKSEISGNIPSDFSNAASVSSGPKLSASSDKYIELREAREKLEIIKQNGLTFDRQYGEWKKQFEDWKDKHKGHPNKQQFTQYEMQWKTWQEQMTKQKIKNDESLKNIMVKIHELENELSVKLEPGTGLPATSNFMADPHNQQGLPMPKPPIRPPMSLMPSKPSTDSMNLIRPLGLPLRSPNSAQGQRPRFSAPNTTNNSSFQNSTQPSGNRQRFNSFRQRHPAPNQSISGTTSHSGNHFSNKTTNSRFSAESDHDFSSRNNFPDESFFEDDIYENEWITEDSSNHNYTHNFSQRPHFSARGRGQGNFRHRHPRAFNPKQNFRPSRPRFGKPNNPNFVPIQRQRIPGQRQGRPMLTQEIPSPARETFEIFNSNSKTEEFKKEEPVKEEKKRIDVNEEKALWNVDRSMLPLSFGKSVANDSAEESKLIEKNFHDGQRINQAIKKTRDEAVVDEQNFGVSDDPDNDYSHYFTGEYKQFDDSPEEQPHSYDFFPRGRGRRGSYFHSRGRGRGYGRGGRLPPYHMREGPRYEKEDIWGEHIDEYDAVAQSSNRTFPIGTAESYLRKENQAARSSASDMSSINTDTLMQKAKELSNMDIKNLLSAVNSVKGSSGLHNSFPGPSQNLEQFPVDGVGQNYNSQIGRRANFDQPGPPGSHHLDIGRNHFESPSDHLSGPLRAAGEGVDLVSLGLKDEDLMLLNSEPEDSLDIENVGRIGSIPYRPVEAPKVVETVDYGHGLSMRDKREFEPWTPTRGRMSPKGYQDRFDRPERNFPNKNKLDFARMDENRIRYHQNRQYHNENRQYSERGGSFAREQESVERHRMSLDRDRKLMETRQNLLDQSRHSREREDERLARERSLERLRRMERELLERERMLNEREHLIKADTRGKRPRTPVRRDDWKPEGYGKERRESPLRGRSDDRSRRDEWRDRERRGTGKDKYRDRSEEKDHGKDRDRDRGKQRDTGKGRVSGRSRFRDDYKGRDESKRWDNDKRNEDSNRRRDKFSPARVFGKDRFGRDIQSSPSQDPMKIGSPIGFRPPSSKFQKLEPIMIRIEDILHEPARQRRPKRIVVILRGLPGSGKSHIAKLIRDYESTHGMTPRVLGLDDYFMVENEKFTVDKDSGRKVKKRVLEYEYEEEMEPTYRGSLVRAFRKTLEDGYFNFVIVDSINDKVEYFSEFWTIAKKGSFEVYVAELIADVHVCAKRNIHKRKLAVIQKLHDGWESTPSHMIRLDVRQMLQDSEIQEVEMGDVSDEENNKLEDNTKEEKSAMDNLLEVPKSKWELMEASERLDKLDGIKKKPARSSMQDMADFLSVTEDYEDRSSAPGKKRVRWADIEEKHTQRRMRDVGFVVGNTDWNRMMDDSHADKALNKTKFI